MTEAPSPSVDAPRSTDRRALLAGLFALALLAIVWSWWGWQQGAWFGVVLLPGGIVLCAGLLVLVQVAPRRIGLRLTPAGAIALAALIALGGWTALSALWSPAPNVALADAQRILVYAVAFGLGFWMVALLGARARLSLVPLATAGAFAGVIAVIGMITTDTPGTFLEDGTLEYPIGYRNANAAFFLIAFFPALGLAADRHLDWRARGPALAAATLCAGLAMLSQSRGSVPAAVIAVAAYVVLSPLRLRAICWLLVAALPAITVIPALTDLFGAASDGGPRAATDELEAAGIAAVRAAAVSLLLGTVAARFERILPGLGSTSPRANRGIAGTLAVGMVAALTAFLVAVGDPIDWTAKRADEFRSGTPELGGEASRFTFNLGTDRYDLWRVALDDGRSQPLRGTGAGGFQYSYLRERESETQTARDAHSVELEIVGELGIPGLALVVTALGVATVGALRSRRFGERQAALSAIALAAGAYWLAHASIDWFWPYPAITAPVLALLGAACAGVVTNPDRGSTPAKIQAEDGASDDDRAATAPPRAAGRLLIAAGALVLALSAVPPFLSERYVNQAYGGWGTDLDRAYDDLDRARALNPLTDAPLLAEGGIADAAGDRERAIAAFRAAAEKRPEEWGAHFLLAELLARDRPELARRELDLARELNPNSPEIDELEDRLAELDLDGGRRNAADAQPD